jgi:mono/diheme cytochrome c family protein
VISLKNRAGLGLAAALLALPVLSSSVAAQKKPAPAPKADAKAGKDLFKKEGCLGCHKTKEDPKAGDLGPDLSMVGKTSKEADILKIIMKPPAGSVMPALKDEKKAKDITAYLLTQK